MQNVKFLTCLHGSKVRFLGGRPFVKQFALCYRTVVCLSCLSVTLVYCGQTVGWIKRKLGVEIGPGHIMLDEDPAPSPQKGPMSDVAKRLDGLRCHLVWR